MTDPNIEDNYLNIKALRFANISERAKTESTEAFNYITFIQEQFWPIIKHTGPFDIFSENEQRQVRLLVSDTKLYLTRIHSEESLTCTYLFHSGELTVNDVTVTDILKISEFFKIIKHFFSLVDQKEYKVRDVI